uniref:G-protein coupled receptors family 1 profile domain-containing protein n=1 Tax=Acrobeloides nanus TaxID=290746 RepID=A0A914DZ95_9BILA
MNISEDTTTTTTMSNISEVTLTASPPLRIFGASSYLFFSSLSTVMNSLLIIILYKDFTYITNVGKTLILAFLS